MSVVDDTMDKVVQYAVDTFLSNYQDDILDEVAEKAREEEEEPADVLEDLIWDWVNRTDIYDEIEELIYEQIDDECMYTDDCVEIIVDYGFSESLSAAQDMGWDFSSVNESRVAAAVLMENMPAEDRIYDEILEQIGDSSSYLELVSHWENQAE